MIVNILMAGLGLVILLLAGDALVRGAVNLALRMGIPALLVSLTIVAFGTSAPELLISIAAIKDDAAGLALGNVVGSNTANILLVLGIPALIAGLSSEGCDTRKTYVMMMVASVVFIALAYFGPFTWWHGIILLLGLAIMLGDTFREARAHRNGSPDEEEDLEEADTEMPGWKLAMFLILGLIGLPLGADILVDSAIAIAEEIGVSDTVIGLTLVAIGTSLPELATTVMAALRRQSDVALGNVIGSNMFNLLAIIGISSFVGEIPVAPNFFAFDFWVMLGASALLAPFVFLHWHLGRAWGVVLTGLYIAYLVVIGIGAAA